MKKKEGFENQILLLIPPEISGKAGVLTKELYFTDIGYFPKAEDHFVSRGDGCSSYILIICKQGHGWIKVDDVRYDIKKNEAVIIDKGKQHSYGSQEERWWEIYWVHFNGLKAKDVIKNLTEILNRPFHLIVGNESFMLFSLICNSLQNGISPLNYDLACCRFWHLAGSLTADRKSGSPESLGIIKQSISYMERNLSGNLTLEKLSNQAGLSPTYFCRYFKNVTGHSPMGQLTQMRIQRACMLLDMTRERISDISRQIGYDDPYYFSRVFRKIMGLSPREYRNRQK